MNKNVVKYFLFFVFSVILVFFDQYSKFLVFYNLKDKTIKLFNGIFELFYYSNKGAAFGILQGQQLLFSILTIIVIVVIFYVLYKLPLIKKYYPIYVFLILIFSGAVGNFIDRIKNGYVVDFIYFKPINFPVFNIADSYITISCILLIICMIFIYKDKDFDFLYKK